MLSQLHPAAFISLENSKQAFIYPLAKLKLILPELEKAEVIWDLEKNIVKILSAEKHSKFASILFPQNSNVLNGKLKFSVKISPAANTSITELLMRAAEAFIGR